MDARARKFHAFRLTVRSFINATVAVVIWSMSATATADDVVGAIPGEFSVGKRGEATYRVPIDIPPGVNDLSPELALAYNSQGGNGVVGIRWSLQGLSGISRCPMTRAQDGESDPVDFDGNDKLCLDGQRLMVTEGAYGDVGSVYHTEIESFQEVRAYGQVAGMPEYFRVRSKDGLIKWYGSSDDSRIELQGTDNPSNWSIKRIEDRFGNFIRFDYKEWTRQGERGEYVVKTIAWGNKHGVEVGSVNFTYEDRADVTKGFRFGSRTAQTQRLTKINVLSQGQGVHEYRLEYEEHNVTGKSQLTAVEKCAPSDPNKCQPETNFNWFAGEGGFDADRKFNFLNDYFLEQAKFGDFDGDGEVDILYVSGNSWHILRMDAVHDPIDLGLSKRDAKYALVADYDGDGRADLWLPSIKQTPNSTYDDYTVTWNIYLGTDNGLTESGSVGEPHYDQQIKYRVDDPEAVRGSVLIDVDGDQVPDLVTRGKGTLRSFLSGNDYAVSESWTGLSIDLSQSITPMEFDGDGEIDLFVTKGDCSGGSSNTGSGSNDSPFDSSDEELQGWEIQKARLSKASKESAERSVNEADDGDPCYKASGVVVNNNGRFDATPINASGFGRERLADINGDGLTDIFFHTRVDSLKDSFSVYLNRGGDNPFRKEADGQVFPDEEVGPEENIPYAAVKLLDYDQDGDKDFIYQSNGRWHVVKFDSGSGNKFRHTSKSFQGLLGANEGLDKHAVMPLGGIGAPGFFEFQGSGVTGYRGKLWRHSLVRGIENGLGRKTVIHYSHLVGPSGRRIYEITDELLKGTTSRVGLDNDGDNQPFVKPIEVVDNFLIDSGKVPNSSGYLNQSWTKTYFRYADGILNRSGRGFLGFRRVETLNVNTGNFKKDIHALRFPFTGMVERSLEKRPNIDALPSFSSHEETASLENLCISEEDETSCEQNDLSVLEEAASENESLTEEKIVNAPKLSETHRQLEERSFGNGVYYRFVKESNERKYEVTSGSLVNEKTTEYEYDDRGNVINVVESLHDGDPGTDDAYTTTTSNTYADNASKWCLGRLATSSVTKSSGGVEISREARFKYDSETCVLDEEIEIDSDERSLTRSYQRDGFGNIVEKTVDGTKIEPRTSRSVYDGLGLHVVRSINPVGQATRTTWHPKFGKKTSVTGPNGLTTEYEYDDFGRRTNTHTPRSREAGAPFASRTERVWCGANCTASEHAVYQVLQFDGFIQDGLKAVAHTEYDKLGREVASLSRDPEGDWLVSEKRYDALGRTRRSNGSHGIHTKSCWSWNHYDAVGRLIASQSPANEDNCSEVEPNLGDSGFKTQSVAFNQPADITEAQGAAGSAVVATARRVVDPEGREKLIGRDARGNKVVVIEYADQGNVVSRYGYDLQGNLVSAKIGDKPAVVMGYDGRGNKDYMNDPDMGEWEYTYNVLGQLVDQEDAKGNVVTLGYDKLGRKIERTEAIHTGTGGAGTADDAEEITTRWVYDVGYGAGIGKLAYVERPDGYLKAFAYNAYGQTTDTVRRIDDEIYWVSQTYDSLGRPDVTVYPDVETVATGSDDLGITQLDTCLGSDSLPEAERCAGGGEVALWWKAVEGAAQYRLYRAEVMDGTATKPAAPLHESMVAPSESEPLVDGPLRDATYKYWLEVCSSDSADECNDPVTATVTVDGPVPVPGQLAVPNHSATGEFGIEWARIAGDIVDPTVDDGISYSIQEAPSEEGTWTSVDCEGSAARCTFFGKPEGKYYYRVRATRDGKTSKWSAPRGPVEVRLKPELSELSIAADPVSDGEDENGQLALQPAGGTLSWSTPHDWADYFEIREYREGGARPEAPTATTRHASWSLPERTTGDWTYAVRACHRAEIYSDDVVDEATHCGKEQTASRRLAPGTPRVGSDGDGNHDGRLDLDLTAAATGTTEHYEIEHHFDPWGNADADGWDLLTGIHTGETFDPGQLENGDYTYRVRACNTANTTQCSDYVESDVFPITIRPAPAQSLTVSPAPPEVSDKGDYRLTWTITLEDDRTTYRLQRAKGPDFDSWESLSAFGEELDCDITSGGTRDNEPTCEPPEYESDGQTASNTIDLHGTSEGTYKHRFAVCFQDVCSAETTASTEVLYLPGRPGRISAPSDKQYDGEYTVSWEAANGKEVAYQLYEGDADFSSRKMVYEGDATRFTAKDRSDGYYRYEVEACNRAGCGPKRTRDDGVRVIRPPSRTGSVSLPTSTSSAKTGFGWEVADGHDVTYEAYVATQSDFSNQRPAAIEKDLSACDPDEPSMECVEDAPQETNGWFRAETDSDHYVRVRACNEAGCGPYRAASNAVNVATTPGRPSSISSPNWDGNGAYTITWGTASGGDLKAYELQEATSSDFSDASRIYRGTGTSKSVSGRGNRRYYYRVRACGPLACSGWESTNTRVYLRPGKPGSLSFPYKNRDRKYTVKWGSASGTVTNYRLAESRNGGSWRRVYKGSNTRKYFGDKADGTYRYRVRACNGPSCSGWRYGDHKLRNYEPPSRPASISPDFATVYYGDSYLISWGESSGTVTKYQLFRSTSSDFSSQSRVYNGSSRSKGFTASSLGAYYFRVRACNPAGCGAYRGVANIGVKEDTGGDCQLEPWKCEISDRGPLESKEPDSLGEGPDDTMAEVSTSPRPVKYRSPASPASGVSVPENGGRKSAARTVSLDHRAAKEVTRRAGKARLRTSTPRSARVTNVAAGANQTPSGTTPARLASRLTGSERPAEKSDDRFVAYPAPEPVEPLRDNAYLQQRHDARTGRIPRPGDMEAKPASTGNHPESGTVDAHMVKRHYNGWGAVERVSELKEENGELVEGEVYWKIQTVNADGRITAERLGNNVVNHRAYNRATGRLRVKKSYPAGSDNTADDLMSMSYSWTKAGNLEWRTDNVHGGHESYTYDRMYRLDTRTLEVPDGTGGMVEQTIDHGYDKYGNLKRRGPNQRNYQYDSAKPHAVTSADRHDADGDFEETVDYSYDANGSAVDAGGRSITWTAFNKPRDIENGGYDARFWYGPDRSRFKQRATTSEGTVETVYVGGLYKKITKVADSGTTQVTHRHFIQAGGRVVAAYDREVTPATGTVEDDTRYWHRDHQGSVVMITQGTNTKDETPGAVVMQTSFTAWGGRRGVPGMDTDSALYWAGYSELSRKGVTRHGYTGHEQLDELGLIHMNGRVYDPDLGRFLSADPMVQSPTNSQNYNRYSYVLNNPLRYTDPSGYNFLDYAMSPISQKAMENEYVHTAGKIALNFIPGCQGWCSMVAGSLLDGVRGYRMTGDMGVGVNSAVQGLASGTVAYGVGEWGGFSGSSWETAVWHGVTQGAISEAYGGDFGAAFASAFVSKSMTPHIPKGKGGYVVAAIIGGTSSKLAGGKFANGAITAAFIFAMNECSGGSNCGDGKVWETSGENNGVGLGKMRKAIKGLAANAEKASSMRDWLYGLSKGELIALAEILGHDQYASGMKSSGSIGDAVKKTYRGKILDGKLSRQGFRAQVGNLKHFLEGVGEEAVMRAISLGITGGRTGSLPSGLGDGSLEHHVDELSDDNLEGFKRMFGEGE